MEIAILVKNAPDRVGQLEVDNAGQVSQQGVFYGLGIYDSMAVETGIHLRDRFGGKVTVLTMGTEHEENCLREAVAMGADQAVRIEAENISTYDPRLAADIVFRSGALNGFDFILGGMKSDVHENGLFLKYLAAQIQIPAVTGIVRIEKDTENNNWRIFRNAGKGDRWVIECDLPVVLGIEKSESEPRYPTMYGRLAAEKCLINLIQSPLSDVGQIGCFCDLIKVSAAKAKPKKIFTPDSSLSAADRMKMLLSGGISKKNSTAGTVSGGDSGAKQVIDLLQQTKVI